MATLDELDEAIEEAKAEAQLKVLSAIPQMLNNAAAVAKLAEAYAWLTFPNQAHGANVAVSK
jgi:hypothetical protein